MGSVIIFWEKNIKSPENSLMTVSSVQYLLFVVRQLTLTFKSYMQYTDIILSDNLHYYFSQTNSHGGRQHRTWCFKLPSIRVHVLVLCTAANIRLLLAIFNNGTTLSHLAHRCTSHLTSMLIPLHSFIS